jgi:uroporphyrinogen decarboxylase
MSFTDNDFRRVAHCLFRRGRPDRVPLWELWVDPAVQGAFLGKEVRCAEDVADFWVTAGYDFVPVSAGILQVGGVLSGKATKRKRHTYSIYTQEEREITWAAEGQGVITSREAFEAFQWPGIDDLDLSHVEAMGRLLPKQMKVICVTGKIYTSVWMLMGYEGMVYALREQPDLVERMFERIGRLQMEVSKRAARLDCVGALWMSDDIAYGQGLLVNPAIYRKHVFPWYKELGAYLAKLGKPFIYHSDGTLWQVFDDLLDCGFNGLHPIEPKAMDIREVKKAIGDRVCLLGSIELDRLSRGTPKEVRELVRRNIKNLAYDGGYCPGSSNSVTCYVPIENYRAMVDATKEFGGW